MKLKKLLSVGLAAVSAFSLSASAMAAAETITISVPSSDTHKYEAYQIFTGDVAEGYLNNVKWGKNGTGTEGEFVSKAAIDALQAACIVDASGISADVLHGNDATELDTILDYVDLTSPPVAPEITNSKPAEGLATGYYLIKDKDNTITGKDTYTQFIVQVAGNIEISRKASSETSIPVIDKQAENKNGADAMVGDTINYSIKVTVPDNIKSYKGYHFVITDTMGDGLTYSSEAPVLKFYADAESEGVAIPLTKSNVFSADAMKAVDGTPAQYATKAKTQSTKAQLMAFSGDVIAQCASINSASYFVLTYKAVVNDNIALGATGANADAGTNKNSAKMDYTNDPNSDGMGTVNTSDGDDVNIYAYKLLVTEVDTDGNPIKGMTVKLYRKNAQGQYVELYEKTTAADGVLTFPTVSSGSYKLVETSVPSGFSKHSDVEFTITGSIDSTGALTGLSCSLSGANANVNTGVITASISNYASAALPVTGTIGIVVLGAAALAACGGAIGLRIKSKKEDSEEA